jgi:hypothetical protein
MNPIHITILLAIAGGLGIIAYRTPLIFQKLYWPLLGSFFLSQLVFFIWTICRSQVYEKLLPFISPDKIQQASQAHSSTAISGIAYLIALVFLAYVGFLRWLTPEIKRLVLFASIHSYE